MNVYISIFQYNADLDEFRVVISGNCLYIILHNFRVSVRFQIPIQHFDLKNVWKYEKIKDRIIWRKFESSTCNVKIRLFFIYNSSRGKYNIWNQCRNSIRIITNVSIRNKWIGINLKSVGTYQSTKGEKNK